MIPAPEVPAPDQTVSELLDRIVFVTDDVVDRAAFRAATHGSAMLHGKGFDMVVIDDPYVDRIEPPFWPEPIAPMVVNIEPLKRAPSFELDAGNRADRRKYRGNCKTKRRLFRP